LNQYSQDLIVFCRVGVAEKGYIIVELSVTTLGGHSSMPPKETSIGILAQAVSRYWNLPASDKSKKIK
jgi:acetylornithine deacetylase/succinyl-diaminopimelate desuccinylase-like protein